MCQQNDLEVSRTLARRIYLYIPAAYRYLNVLGDCVEAILQQAAENESNQTLVYQARLATHETCTNIIEHAYQNQFGYIQASLIIEKKPARLVIDFYDNGQSFNLNSVAQPDLDVAQSSGYGLFLIQQLMDEVVYETYPGENHWRLVKTLAEDPG